MTKTESGALRKLTAQLGDDGNIEYQLPVGDTSVALNPLIRQ